MGAASGREDDELSVNASQLTSFAHQVAAGALDTLRRAGSECPEAASEALLQIGRSTESPVSGTPEWFEHVIASLLLQSIHYERDIHSES